MYLLFFEVKNTKRSLTNPSLCKKMEKKTSEYLFCTVYFSKSIPRLYDFYTIESFSHVSSLQICRIQVHSERSRLQSIDKYFLLLNLIFPVLSLSHPDEDKETDVY